MDDERWQPGMPVLDRQGGRAPLLPPQPPAPLLQPQPPAPLLPPQPPLQPHEPLLPPSLQGLPPRSVPELRPTPLQRHYISLSVVALIAGAIAITALELGVPLGSPLVKACVAIGAPPLALTTADATLRIWRSAWAWMPVNPGRGAFRLAWVAATVLLLALLVGVAWLVLQS